MLVVDMGDDPRLSGGVAVILPAAGKGMRFGGGGGGRDSEVGKSGSVIHEPKQFVHIGRNSAPLFIHALNAFCRMPFVSVVVLVVPAEYLNTVDSSVLTYGCKEVGSKLVVIAGGETRHRSIKQGVERLRKLANKTVIIHDAVRPFVDENICSEVVKHADHYGACGVYQPLVSTVIRLDDEGFLVESLPRDSLVSSEMPQAFKRDNLLTAYESATDAELDRGTEILALVKKYTDCQIKMLPVDPNRYFKVTYEKDLVQVQAQMSMVDPNSAHMKRILSSEKFVHGDGHLDNLPEFDYP